ncbi:MAG: hypothetical protein ABIE94_06245 [archaeon]
MKVNFEEGHIRDPDIRKPKKKFDHKKIIILVGIIAIIIVILIVIKVRMSWWEVYGIQVPHEVQLQSQNQGAQGTISDCEKKIFAWEYAWAGWAPPLNDYISPIFLIHNREYRTGEFQIRFMFFDDYYWSHEEYGTKTYDEVADILPLTAVSFYSKEVNIILGPDETKNITIYTRKNNPTGNFWAYADVEVPFYYDCPKDSVSENNTKNSTGIVYVTERRAEAQTTRVPLWKFLWIMLTR